MGGFRERESRKKVGFRKGKTPGSTSGGNARGESAKGELRGGALPTKKVKKNV